MANNMGISFTHKGWYGGCIEDGCIFLTLFVAMNLATSWGAWVGSSSRAAVIHSPVTDEVEESTHPDRGRGSSASADG